MTIQIPPTKYCPDCGKDRPAALFGRNKGRYDGLTSYCHQHQLERDRKRREQNPGLFRAYHRKYQNKMRKEKQAEQMSLIAPVKRECNCKRYSGKNPCLICRNAERRAAFKQNRVPVYLAGVMQAAGG